MRSFSRTTQFKKDVKRADKRGKDLTELKAVLNLLIEGNHSRQNTKIIHYAAILLEVGTAIFNPIGF